MEAAGRVGGHYRPYYAARSAADIALDRGDLSTARKLLTELDQHAAAIDAAAGNTMADEAAQRHRGLAELTAAPAQPAPG